MDFSIEAKGIPSSPEELRDLYWQIANALRQLITERISSGELPDGAPFLDGLADKYSSSYEKKKIANGRLPYSPGDRFVYTGEMMGAFDVVECDETGATIGFHSADMGYRAFVNHERRPAFDFTDEDFDAAFDAAMSEVT